MVIAFLIFLSLWAVAMTALLTPSDWYKNTFDKITHAKYRSDRINLQIMLDNLQNFPEQWSISREGASFPKEGAKQIYLNYDKKDGWEYTLNSFGGRARPLRGHFESEFKRALDLENNNREKVSLLRNFYPDMDGPLLLERYK